MEIPKYIYLVISRDDPKVQAYVESSDAMVAKTEREYEEEMAGGRPSVWVDKVKLIVKKSK